ncbi:hypothetical protein GCM10023340_12440 [Nocardioides marinquilinus]|uniref:J domain-containing protein n=1 Tax=Nocardioides marinquilinus TaxID=1210400 RepID=A0ABP9PCY3_9ACTN
MSPSWYDVLGVEHDATPEEIRAAWKDSIADLDPTDRRFRQRSRAAEVLLDPQRRAEHDADLAGGGDEADDEPDDTDDTDDTADEQDADAADRPAARTAAPTAAAPAAPAAPPAVRRDDPADQQPVTKPAATPAAKPAATAAEQDDEPAPAFVGPWLVVALGLLAAVLVVACVVAVTRGGEEPAAGSTSQGSDDQPSGDAGGTDADGLPDAVAVDAARRAAESAVVPVLAYDYRRLDEAEQAAVAVMTPEFAEEYRQLFAAIRENAPRTQTIVQVEPVASGISGTGRGIVDVLLFVDRPTTNIQRSFISEDQVILRMTDETDGSWRVGCIIAVPRTPGVGAACDGG